MSTAIVPTQITEVKDVDSFEVTVARLELFQSVTVSVLLKNGPTCVGVRTLTFEGPDYLAWNNDDSYLIDLVANKLGFVVQT